LSNLKKAAINAKEAGFDGVEIHGANGYLVTQFLDNTANQRTDQWGGSVENRSRFGLEVLKATKEVFGRNVSIKLSPSGGYNDVGMPLPETVETYNYFITEAEKLDLAYIVLVRYGGDLEIDGKIRGIKHDVLETFSPSVKNTKLFLNVQVSAEEGEKLVSAGKIDGIFIGFNWITHPDVVKRVLHGKPLNNIPDIPHLQTKSESGDWGVGYTNYPTAVY
jgi:2,4-dienoyl-CoA reductase-like NADH-dependent reductase (Old Yellow Enzyme family)